MCAVKLVPNEGGVIDWWKDVRVGGRTKEQNKPGRIIEGVWFWIENSGQRTVLGIQLGNFGDVYGRVFGKITVEHCAENCR